MADIKKSDATFAALYYPETICLNEVELKYLLLLYDRIYFLPIDVRLNPGHASLSNRFSANDGLLTGAFKSRKEAYYSGMYAGDFTGWDYRLKTLMALYDDLEQQDIVTGLQEPEFSDTSREHPLKVAVDADMADSEFLSLCLRLQNSKVFIPKSDSDAKMKGGGIAVRPPSYTGDRFVPSICSERLNTALFISGRDSLFPVCGSKMYMDLLKAKLKRAALVSPEFTVPPRSAHRFSLLSWEIVTEVVPRDVIQSRPAKDLLTYKSACIDLKQKFRDYLWKLEGALTAEPWEEKISLEFDKIVKKEIVPEVQRIREQKIGIWEKLFSESLTAISLKVAPPLVGIQLVLGLSYWEILTLSTSAFGAATLKPLIDAWQEERQVRRNALFFLVRLQKR